MHGRGYRFVAHVETGSEAARNAGVAGASLFAARTAGAEGAPPPCFRHGRSSAAHAAGAASSDAALLDDAATTFEQCGTPLLAAEAATELADCLDRHGDEQGAADARARVARLRAALPAGITTPLLAGAVR